MAVKRGRGQNTKPKKYEYGLQVVGVTRMWVNEVSVKSKKNGQKYRWLKYVTSVGRKEEDGTYTNIYIPIFFAKDIDPPEDDCLIAITSANIFITGNEGYEELSLYVKDYSIVDE